MKLHRFVILCGLAAIVGSGLWIGRPAHGDDAAKAAPVYELRTYYAHPGKMADLHKRFKDHTLKMFEKHGMKNIAYWSPTDKADEVLIYVIEHKSREAAEKSWAAFKADPEWQAAFKESHKNGPLVKKADSVYMTATEYSPMK